MSGGGECGPSTACPDRGLSRPSCVSGRSASGWKDAKHIVKCGTRAAQAQKQVASLAFQQTGLAVQARACLTCTPARRWGRAHVDVVLPAHGRGGRVHRGRALLFAPLSPPWAPSGAPREGCPQRRAQVTPPARGHGRCHRAGAAGLPAPAGGTRRRLGLVLAADIDKGLPSKAQADPPDRWRCGEIIKTVRSRKRERHSDRSASCGEQD